MHNLVPNRRFHLLKVVTNEDTRNLAGVIFPLFSVFLKPVSESDGRRCWWREFATKTVTKNRTGNKIRELIDKRTKIATRLFINSVKLVLCS